MLTVCTNLLHDYAGDVDALHAAAKDTRDLESRLKALGKGIGDTTVGIFLRELRGIWSLAAQPLSPLALLAAQKIGYLRPDNQSAARALKKLQQIWEEDGQKVDGFADFEAALVREGLHLRRAQSRHSK